MMKTMPGQWIFGYGSLVWRPAFEYLEKKPAYIEGWQRRFWQASPDHRGTPLDPGRVVTLLRTATAVCWGMAYRVPRGPAQEILAELDHRERAGYERVRTELHVQGRGSIEDVLLYIADADNPNYVGPETDEETAAIIERAHGPSGSNREYLTRLADELVDMQVEDAHVRSLMRLLR